MSRFWNQRTNSLKPYVPGEQPGDGQKVIKLNTNECPYPPSPAVREALAGFAGVDFSSLRLYPNADGLAARQAFARRAGLETPQVFAGNGSDEVLAIAFQTFFGNGAPLWMPQISYSFYPVYCQLYGIENRVIPMKPDLSIDLEAFLKTDAPCGGVVLANPNAPTTLALTLEQIELLLQAHQDCVVLVDEAYVDFGGESALVLIPKYENLLVVQTLSKSRALAGMRVGFAAGSKELIEGMDRVKNSFNSYPLDRIAIACAAASLEDESYFCQTVEKIMATRRRTAENLEKMGFTVLDSKANFLFVSHPNFRADMLFHALKQRGILVRYFNQPQIDNYLRISIGTDAEMAALCFALEKILETEGQTPE